MNEKVQMQLVSHLQIKTLRFQQISLCLIKKKKLSNTKLFSLRQTIYCFHFFGIMLQKTQKSLIISLKLTLIIFSSLSLTHPSSHPLILSLQGCSDNYDWQTSFLFGYFLRKCLYFQPSLNMQHKTTLMELGQLPRKWTRHG